MPRGVHENLVIVLDLKGDPEQLSIAVVATNPTGSEAVGEQSFTVHIRQDESSGCRDGARLGNGHETIGRDEDVVRNPS